MFEPTEQSPEGEYHIDKGFISFDKIRKLIIFRQFNIEGYVNQYALNESISTKDFLVFDSESIENFVEGGKTQWTVKKINENHIETKFNVSFPGSEYACLGTNQLYRMND